MAEPNQGAIPVLAVPLHRPKCSEIRVPGSVMEITFPCSGAWHKTLFISALQFALRTGLQSSLSLVVQLGFAWTQDKKQSTPTQVLGISSPKGHARGLVPGSGESCVHQEPLAVHTVAWGSCVALCVCAYICAVHVFMHRHHQEHWAERYRNMYIYGDRKYCVFQELVSVCAFTRICMERERNQEGTGHTWVLIKNHLAGGFNAALWTQLRTDLKKNNKTPKTITFFLSFPLTQAASQSINPEFSTKDLAEVLEGKRQEGREEEQRGGLSWFWLG